MAQAPHAPSGGGSGATADPEVPAGPGIRQFIDIGAGLPTQGNTHEVVRRGKPDARVVYVDHDPMVLAHAQQLLSGTAATRFVLADLRDPASVLGHPELLELIDLSEPTALLMTAVLHFVADSDGSRVLSCGVARCP